MARIINVKMEVVKEKEVDLDKTDGEEMIDGVVDRPQMTEALPVTVETKITRTLFLYVPEISCNFLITKNIEKNNR